MKITKQKRIRYRYKVLRGNNEVSSFAQDSFRLIYKKGTVVKAIAGSLGIFVFKRKKDAEEWIRTCVDRKTWASIIKRVIPIGRGKQVMRICAGTEDHVLLKYYLEDHYKNFNYMFPPDGTIVYPAVRVID